MNPIDHVYTAPSGSVFIADTGTHSGLDCVGFFVLTNCVVDEFIALERDGNFNTNSPVGMGTLVAGQWVPGWFKQISLLSGSIQCIKS